MITWSNPHDAIRLKSFNHAAQIVICELGGLKPLAVRGVTAPLMQLATQSRAMGQTGKTLVTEVTATALLRRRSSSMRRCIHRAIWSRSWFFCSLISTAALPPRPPESRLLDLSLRDRPLLLLSPRRDFRDLLERDLRRTTGSS